MELFVSEKCIMETIYVALTKESKLKFIEELKRIIAELQNKNYSVFPNDLEKLLKLFEQSIVLYGHRKFQL